MRLLALVLLTSAAYAAQVNIKLYPMSESDWSTVESASLASLLVAEANTYCAANNAECDLSANATFLVADVSTSDLKDSSKSLKLNVALSYPSGTSSISGETTLPTAVMETILGNIRDDFHTATDTYITYVGSEYYGIPPDTTANSAIIPVAFGVVIIAAAITVGLVKWQSSKERAETLRARQERRKENLATKGEAPSTAYNTMDNTHTTIASATTTPRQTQPQPQPYTYTNNNQVSPQPTTPVFRAPPPLQKRTTLNEFHPEPAVEMEKNGLSHRLYDDPAEIDDEEALRKERKRRRKERKREKERVRQQQLESSLEMYDNQGMDSSVLTESDQSKVPTFKV